GLLVSTCQRQPHAEHAPFAKCAINNERSAEQRQQLARHAEAESGASSSTRRMLLDLPERFEDALEIFGRDADSGVAHVDHELFVIRARGHRDASVLSE